MTTLALLLRVRVCEANYVSARCPLKTNLPSLVHIFSMFRNEHVSHLMFFCAAMSGLG